MGTKNNPGKVDCYANAAPDEPMFVLLGRDRHAGGLVRLWALLRHREGEDGANIEEALKCAAEMDGWLLEKKKICVSDIAATFESLLIAATAGMEEHPDGYVDACDCDLCRSYAE